VGVDYNGPYNFYANFQFSQTVILAYDKTILFFDELTHEFNGQLSRDFFNNDIKLALRYFYNITNNSFYVNPYVVFQRWQNVHIELGGDLLDGPRDAVVGIFRNNDQGYITLRVNF
jgi:hypothetical protein